MAITGNEYQNQTEEALEALITNQRELEVARLASQLAIASTRSGNTEYNSIGIARAAHRIDHQQHKNSLARELEEQLNLAFRLAVQAHIKEHGYFSVGWQDNNDITSVLSKNANVGFEIAGHRRAELGTLTLAVSPIAPLADILRNDKGEWGFNVDVDNEDYDQFTHFSDINAIYGLSMYGPLNELTSSELESIVSDVKQLVTAQYLVSSDVLDGS